MATSLSQPDLGTPLDSSLWHEYRRTRDPRLREQLLERHSGLVIHAARRLADHPDTVEDLIQEGYLGLLRAIDHFDPGRGVVFATFAFPSVSGAMMNYLRDRANLIREPESVRALRGRVNQAAVKLAERGQAPTVERLAAQVGAGEGAVRQALKARPSFHSVSIDGPGSEDPEAGEARGPRELSVSDDFASALPDHLLVAEALGHLTPTERAVIEHFFYNDLNQREIAQALGRSCSNVSRSLKRALKKLRTLMARADQEPTQSAPDPGSHPPVIRPAIVDAETGLFVRSHFRRCLIRALGPDRAEDDALCLVLVSLDPVADNRSVRSLSRLSALIRQNTRAGDLAFRLRRWVLALLVEEPQPLVSLVCQRIADLAGQRAHPLVVSMGLAEWPNDARSPAKLLLSARRGLIQELRSAPGGHSREVLTGQSPGGEL